MRKIIGFILVLAAVFSFGFLVYWGFLQARGTPVLTKKIERSALPVSLIKKNINLASKIEEEFWKGLASAEIKLVNQVMVLPWGKSLMSPLEVKAFHNGREIYFHLKWKDSTEDRILERDRFSDACAIMFPLGENIPPSAIMMGFMTQSNIWQWKASQDAHFWEGRYPLIKSYADYFYPFEEEETLSVSKDLPVSAVNDLLTVRVGTITPKPTQPVAGRGFFKDGSWQVVFKRGLSAENLETDAVFKTGEKRLCAFALWNGAHGDRGGRKSISDWVELEIQR